MGVGRLLCNLFLGPLLIYAVLVTHVLYQSFVKSPEVKAGDVQAPSWPSSVSAKDRAELVALRKSVVKDYMDAIVGRGIRDFASKHWTKDFQFEDPFQRYSGAEEAADAWTALAKCCGSAEARALAEQHGPHEIVLPIMYSPFKGWKSAEIYIVAHLLLEPPGKKGEPEKIFKIYDEYQGNPLLNERTVNPSVLGKVHSKLRVFQGNLAILLMRTFGLT